MNDAELEERKRIAEANGKRVRFRRFKEIKTGIIGVQWHEWAGDKPCPFGPFWSEEKMQLLGMTWVL